MRSHNGFLLVLSMMFIGCGLDPLAYGLEQKEANRIIELLADHEINAQKHEIEGRIVTFTVLVKPADKLEAIRLLNYYDLPRRLDRGYKEVYAETGLIPTSTEEKAKQLAALEGEIERQLKIFDGILDVQVQIVVPDENALQTAEDQRTPTTASVTITHLQESKPLSESQVQTIVAGGVEKLTADRVYVVMIPSRASAKRSAINEGANALVTAASQKKVIAILIVVSVFFVIAAVGVVLSNLRAQRIRTQLERLQAEIQKAKTKQEGESSSTSS